VQGSAFKIAIGAGLAALGRIHSMGVRRANGVVSSFVVDAGARGTQPGQIDQAIYLLVNCSKGSKAPRKARVSRVSLGKLYMNKNLAGAALQQFSDYLVAGGPLEEEALVGRAQALAALGRRSEELSTWQMLITQFPSSVYAQASAGTPKLLDQRLGN